MVVSSKYSPVSSWSPKSLQSETALFDGSDLLAGATPECRLPFASFPASRARNSEPQGRLNPPWQESRTFPIRHTADNSADSGYLFAQFASQPPVDRDLTPLLPLLAYSLSCPVRDELEHNAVEIRECSRDRFRGLPIELRRQVALCAITSAST